MKHFKITLLIALISFASIANAQEKVAGPSYVGKTTSMEHVPSIASQRNNWVPAFGTEKEMLDGRSSKNIVIPGKDPQTEDDYFVRNPSSRSQTTQGREASLVFDAYNSNSMPTDPSIAIGPNHAFVVFNTGFTIYDKSGNELVGQTAPNPTIFPNGGCCDLTASYDKAADRWVISFLDTSNGAQIAVSDGPDPVNDGWYVYTISSISDYQKLSIWSDGYYLTDNTSSSNKVWAMERDKMLLGDTTAQVVGFNLPGIVTSGFFSPQVFNVTDENMPASGNAPIVYLQDDAWGGVATDHLKIWSATVDWTNTANSNISGPVELNTNAPFIGVFDNGSFSNLAQPNGQLIDALQATIMNQAQFRKFANHNSAVFNFVVDTDAGAGKLAGVRWFELRQNGDGQPWSIYQEGTYTAPDGRHAWHASMMMDIQGNIGMGYSSMSGPSSTETDMHVSSFYTGRFANDPLNTMTIAEEVIANGDGDMPSNRYGDYSKIDIDPENDKTFWFINEYFKGQRKGVVGVFQIAPNFNDDVGIVSIDAPVSGILTNSESITVTIFNYGENAASNFDISYQIDGGTVVTETYSGTIPSAQTATYTFTTPANFSTEGQTYSVLSQTTLTGDEDTSNDSFTQEITHLTHDDIGVIAISAPISGINLGSETVTISVENFAEASQSNFNVSYAINGGAVVTEQVAGPLGAGETIEYSFSTQGNFSAFIEHTLSATTSLGGDSDTSNDEMSIMVSNASCDEFTNTTSQQVGPDSGTVTNSIINLSDDDLIQNLLVSINISHTYNSNLDIFLIGPDGTRVELSTDNGGYTDDYIDTVFDDDADTSITNAIGPFTGTYRPEGALADFVGLSSLGNWTLEITDDANGGIGTLNSWSIIMCSTSGVGIYDNLVDASDLIVKSLGENQFNISLTTDIFNENILFQVYDSIGKEIVYHRISKEDGVYAYPLDMSYMASGVYIIRLSDKNVGMVKRIIVE